MPTRPEIQAARRESSPSVGETFCTDTSSSCTGSEPLFITFARLRASVSENVPLICTLPLNVGTCTSATDCSSPSSSIAI